MVRLRDFRVKRSGNKNRGRLEIVRDMLSVSTERTKKTRIMYQANLSYQKTRKNPSMSLYNIINVKHVTARLLD